MKLLGKVLDTFSAKKDSVSSMPRPRVEFLNLIKDYGIEFDKFAQKDLDKTVMILGIDSYNLAKSKDINLEYGSLGENLLFSFNPHEFELGTQFIIGDAIIEITEKCTICNHLSVFHKKLPKTVKDCRGLYCKIINSGSIKKDLPIYLKD